MDRTPSPETAGVSGSQPVRPSGGNMPVNARVLVIEDDYASQQTLRALLQRMGHTPVVVDRGEQALRLLESPAEVDLAISDVVMPGMSGIEFAERAHRVRPSMPVLLVTGDTDTVDSLLARGAVALLKPYSPDTLERVLGETLEGGRSR